MWQHGGFSSLQLIEKLAPNRGPNSGQKVWFAVKLSHVEMSILGNCQHSFYDLNLTGSCLALRVSGLVGDYVEPLEGWGLAGRNRSFRKEPLEVPIFSLLSGPPATHSSLLPLSEFLLHAFPAMTNWNSLKEREREKTFPSLSKSGIVVTVAQNWWTQKAVWCLLNTTVEVPKGH